MLAYYEEIKPWAQIVELVYLTMILILGVPGNLIVTIIQWRNPAKSSTDYLVFTLAAFELICAGFNVPFQIFRNTILVWQLMYSSLLCRTNTFSFAVIHIGSSLLLASIATDRFIRSCKPLVLRYSSKSGKTVAFVITLTSVIVAAPYLLIDYRLGQNYKCSYDESVKPFLERYDLFLVLLVIATFIVISFSYLAIAVALQKRARQMKKSTSLSKNGISVISSRRKHVLMTILFRNNRIRPENMTQGTAILSKYDVSKPNAQHGKQNHGATISATVKRNNAPMLTRILAFSATPSSLCFCRKPTAVEPEGSEQMVLRRKTANNVTLSMFLISFLYMITWVATWLNILAHPFGPEIEFLSYSFYMVNCISNPIIYVLMSRKFRASVVKLINKS